MNEVLLMKNVFVTTVLGALLALCALKSHDMYQSANNPEPLTKETIKYEQPNHPFPRSDDSSIPLSIYVSGTDRVCDGATPLSVYIVNTKRDNEVLDSVSFYVDSTWSYNGLYFNEKNVWIGDYTEVFRADNLNLASGEGKYMCFAVPHEVELDIMYFQDNSKGESVAVVHDSTYRNYAYLAFPKSYSYQ